MYVSQNGSSKKDDAKPSKTGTCEDFKNCKPPDFQRSLAIAAAAAGDLQSSVPLGFEFHLGHRIASKQSWPRGFHG